MQPEQASPHAGDSITVRTKARDSDVIVVFLEGSLDRRGAAALRDDVHALISNGARQLLVDLSGVAMLDSSGMSVLIAAMKAARNNGGDLRVAGANARVVALLKLAKLYEVLKPVDADSEAYG